MAAKILTCRGQDGSLRGTYLQPIGAFRCSAPVDYVKVRVDYILSMYNVHATTSARWSILTF